MRAFRNTKRRTTQQIMQSLGVAKGGDDTQFQIECENYKKSISDIKALQAAIKNHLKLLQGFYNSSSTISGHLQKFLSSSDFDETINKYSSLQRDLEKIQVASIERTYQEKIISALDEILWQVPEIEEQIKQRKGLLLDYNAHLRKYETAKTALAALTSSGEHTGSNGGGLFSRRKNENELADDVLTRKMKLDQAEMAVTTVTDWLRKKFQDLEDQIEAGDILRNPLSALAACEYHLSNEISSRYNEMKHMIPLAGEYNQLLTQYDTEFAKAAAEVTAQMPIGRSNTFANAPQDTIHLALEQQSGRKILKLQSMSKNNVSRGEDDGHHHHHHGSNGVVGCFNQSLRSLSSGENSLPPSVVFDCIEYLDNKTTLNCEGIFRLSGSQDSVLKLKKIYEYDTLSHMDQLQGADFQDVATLLKSFFRDLPEPLIPCDRYNALLTAANSVSSLSNETDADIDANGLIGPGLDDTSVAVQNSKAAKLAEAKNEAIRKVCDIARSIPVEHLQCLGLLLHFLSKVSKNAAKNKMNALNLATCLAPSLLRAPDNTPPQKVLQDMQIAIAAIIMLIENADQFPLPRRKSNKKTECLPPVTPNNVLKSEFSSKQQYQPSCNPPESFGSLNFSAISDEGLNF